MSIKKLFQSTKNKRNYLSDKTEKDAFSSVESMRNVDAIKETQEAFVPQIDYSKPEKFARYGSAYLYYKSAIERIYNYYPYDGSDAELNEFYNKSLEIEKYIFNIRYPRTNGYIRLSNSGWGTRVGAQQSNYGLSDTLEYITFFGGPGTASTPQSLKDSFPTDYNDKFQQANLYETDIYSRQGLPSDYGSGSRQSNLKSDFDTGVTVEFWLKKPAFTTGSTGKEIILDVWNNNASSSADYGRLTVEIRGNPELAGTTPFRLTAQSGTSGIFQQTIGNDLNTGSFESFKHYAIVFQNSGSVLTTKLYVNGKLNDTNNAAGTLNELNSKNMMGRIGSLITNPSASSAESGWGKLSASLDEFRFWKVARNSEQIAENWFAPVHGGSNTDIGNADLGVYFKFNEGIVGSASVDSVVLDYSGRVTNGAWTGYATGGRTTTSAIVQASASAAEYKDPIIYEEHPDVVSLKAELLKIGSEHDINNHTSFASLMPGWVHEEEGNSKTTDTQLMSHIVGTYLDKLYLQIEAVSGFKTTTYTSASYTPLPFAQHLPQSLGLYTPELFVDANVLENFVNRDASTLFSGDLTETKNLIYLNLYNNLANIYKAKGTEKSIRNVFRCFNIDERLIRLNVYSNNQTYELQNNLKQTLRNKVSINFNHSGNIGAVVYSTVSGSGPNTTNYISGSNALGYEDKYGFTLEADVTLPSFNILKPKYDLHSIYPSASLFGMRSASINSDVGTTLPATDYANFDVCVAQDAQESKNGYFKLTSSYAPHTFPELTSSIFYNIYDNDRWNISVRLKPSNYPVTDIVSGSDIYTYDLEFRGVNTLLGEVQDSFFLTASVSKTLGQSMLNSAKRIYVGAHRTNVTGTVIASANSIFSGIRYWGRYIDDSDLDQHVFDVDNAGLSGSYQNISPLDSNNQKYDLINNKMLFLDWNFNQVTGSDPSGNFYVQDMSSGSAALRTEYGWIGNLSNYQHTGYGYGFTTSSTEAVKRQSINSYKFVDPESPMSSEMIQILSEDDKVFKITENVPSYFYAVEKSMYNAISEEMLDFFAGAVDFNNIIGEPVNRYRERYKTMEKLRETFFQRVTTVSDVEKFITYYKWFDDALTSVISQLVPASVEFADEVLNTVESHVLERNKYQSKFPTIEFRVSEPDPPIMGINEKLYNWRLNYHPVNNQQNTNSPWWRQRANRKTNTVISTPNSTAANTDRERWRKNIANDNNASASLLTSVDKVGYYGSTYVLRKLAKPYKLDFSRRQIIKGGVNFTDTKNTEFTRNALAPAGPINRDETIFVPSNVLLGFTDDFVPLKDSVDVTEPNKKVKRYLKVQTGREWEDGLGYSNVKSSYAFPFNIMSSSVTTGYNAHVVDRASSSIEITNLHYDAYGPDLEVPMQGPFTNYAVGGLQSRHIRVNTGSAGGLDNWRTRPEAWKIVVGKCSSSAGVTGAIGMVGADYPTPEANAKGVTPYPLTASQKAVYYRDFIAKRPVNIRNIHARTGSTILGNYSQNYEVVSTVGAYSNPRNFIDNQPALPTQITETPSASQGRTFLGTHRIAGAPRHIELIPSYSIGYLRDAYLVDTPGYVTRSANKTVITGRFAAPGGIDTMGLGYLDIRSGEYSVYNALNYRNLSVRRPGQPTTGSSPASEVPAQAYIAGTPGIKLNVNGGDFGLNALLSRHCGRFGRDSYLVTNPGASYEQTASFIKIQRNGRPYLVTDGIGGVATSSQYDNFWVQHSIPRNDRQYAWVTNSLAPNSNDIRYYGRARTNGIFRGLYSASTGYTAFFNYVTASDVGSPKHGATFSDDYLQVTNRLNLFTIDPVNDVPSTGLSNSLGVGLGQDMTSYLNSDLLQDNGIWPSPTPSATASAFNLLMTRRGGSYGWGWNSARNSDHPVLKKHYKENLFSVYDQNQIKNYIVHPVSKRGKPTYVNMDIDTQNLTLVVSNNNENIYFGSPDLDNMLINGVSSYDTALGQVLTLAKSADTYRLNWLLYSETLFPSVLREYTASTRIGYDNKMWRDDQAKRTAPRPSSLSGGFGALGINTFGIDVSQSCWPLDAPFGFLTRTSQPVGTLAGGGGARFNYFLEGGGGQAGGELQNIYSHVIQLTPAAFSSSVTSRLVSAAPGTLYARKHCLPSPKSVVSPSSIAIPETGSLTNVFTDKINKFGGEALWEAPTQAGIVLNVAAGSIVPQFHSFPSEPWFDTYDDFHYDLKVVAKDYAVIPEFRISTHVEEYEKFGLFRDQVADTFEIVGTGIDSSTGSFYRDYSNSEFMHSFVDLTNLDDSLLPSQIRLVCSASIRFNPYKGFYPAQRTLDLVNQFSRSYGGSISAKLQNDDSIISRPGGIAQSLGGLARPLMSTLFAPGILFNSIKSGMAVDYPIVTDASTIRTASYGSTDDTEPNWMLTADYDECFDYHLNKTRGYLGGPYFERIPFEAILEPEKYLNNMEFYDVEPDPSCSFHITASFNAANTDSIYTKMASNFFGEAASFYLKDEKLSALRSGIVPADLQFKEGDAFFGRLMMGQTYNGIKSYQYESGASGDNTAYSDFGGRQFINGAYSDASFPLPQYPRQNLNFRRNHVMYSRPSAFGPAVSGQPTGSLGIDNPLISASSPVDSMYGFNWAYTPPYYDGEAWIDFVFYPTASVSYDLERILSEMKTEFWRCDPGPWDPSSPVAYTKLTGPTLIATYSQRSIKLALRDPDPGGCLEDYGDCIYDGKNVNANAMQLSASVNYFGIERVQRERKDAQGNKENTENETMGMRWVIQPKWETPILNFADVGAHAITNATGTLSIPQFASSSVPRGMWHQFGVDTGPDVGIFMELGDIPSQWLKYHYQVVQTASIYNDQASGSALTAFGPTVYQNARSLKELVNFGDNSKVKLGQLAEKRTIYEAIVVVPYLVDGLSEEERQLNPGGLGPNSRTRKSFFEIPRARIDACLDDKIGTKDGDSLTAAGESIRRLVQKMEKYVMPPQFDWLSNSNVKPITMYMFEFAYEFDRDDLIYMWQNLAPRNYKKMEFELQSTAHDLLDTELLGVDALRNDNMRWMVFKVKQRATTQYDDLVASTAGQSSKDISPRRKKTKVKAQQTKAGNYEIQFNWPYDYVSFVELVKFDAEILYRPSKPKDLQESSESYSEPGAALYNKDLGIHSDDKTSAKPASAAGGRTRPQGRSASKQRASIGKRSKTPLKTKTITKKQTKKQATKTATAEGEVTTTVFSPKKKKK